MVGVTVGHMIVFRVFFTGSFISRDVVGCVRIDASGIDSMFMLGMIVFVHFIHSFDFREYKVRTFTFVIVFINLMYCFWGVVSNDLNNKGGMCELLSRLS